MIEVTGIQVIEKIKEKNRAVIYVYTPLCGTCQVAKKMLTVVEAALPGLEIHMIDLNYAPHLARDYEIESVPCLLVFEDEELVKRIYAFQSVEYLYYELQ